MFVVLDGEMKTELASRTSSVFLLIAAMLAIFAAANRAQQPTPAAPAIAPQASQMQVVLLGTGVPGPSAVRAGPSAAIVVGEKIFIVDAGRGVVMRLAGAKLPLL